MRVDPQRILQERLDDLRELCDSVNDPNDSSFRIQTVARVREIDTLLQNPAVSPPEDLAYVMGEVKELYRTAPEIDGLVQSILFRVEAAPKDFDQALAQFKEGKISREVFERKIVEYFYTDSKYIVHKLLEFEPDFFDNASLLEELRHSDSIELFNALVETKGLNLPQDRLDRLAWELTKSCPDEAFKKWGQLPFSIDEIPLSKKGKEACLLHILSTCKEGDRAALLARLKEDGYKSVELNESQFNSELFGRILGRGICYAVVRCCIEKIISGKEMPESFVRFVQAGHKHSSALLPARIEAKFKSKGMDILKVNGFSNFKDVLNILATRRQQFMIVLSNPAAESRHAIHLSLEDPPGYGFADPNDFVGEVHQPPFHRFESRDEAIKAFELFVAQYYPGWQIAFLERYE